VYDATVGVMLKTFFLLSMWSMITQV